MSFSHLAFRRDFLIDPPTKERKNIMTEDINNNHDEFEPEFEDELEPEASPDPLFDPTEVITLRTSGGETRYIPTLEPMTLAEVKATSGLTFGVIQFSMNTSGSKL
jgi:hypothetical protein